MSSWSLLIVCHITGSSLAVVRRLSESLHRLEQQKVRICWSCRHIQNPMFQVLMGIGDHAGPCSAKNLVFMCLVSIIGAVAIMYTKRSPVPVALSPSTLCNVDFFNVAFCIVCFTRQHYHEHRQRVIRMVCILSIYQKLQNWDRSLAFDFLAGQKIEFKFRHVQMPESKSTWCICEVQYPALCDLIGPDFGSLTLKI